MRIMLELDKGFSVQRERVGMVVARQGTPTGETIIYVDGQHHIVVRDYETVMNALHAPEIDVMEAAQTLVDLLDQAAPHLHRLSEIGLAAEMPYEGPQFKNELEDLRIALAQAK